MSWPSPETRASNAEYPTTGRLKTGSGGDQEMLTIVSVRNSAVKFGADKPVIVYTYLY